MAENNIPFPFLAGQFKNKTVKVKMLEENSQSA